MEKNKYRKLILIVCCIWVTSFIWVCSLKLNWWIKDQTAEHLPHMDSLHKNSRIIFSNGSLDRGIELIAS